MTLRLFDYKNEVGGLLFGEKFHFFQWFDKGYQTASRWTTFCIVNNNTSIQVFSNKKLILSVNEKANLTSNIIGKELRYKIYEIGSNFTCYFLRQFDIVKGSHVQNYI